MNVKASTLQQRNYTSPIDKVFDRVNYEHRSASSSQEFKLDTIRLILSKLNNPQDQLNIVHIAGTKGKGSTAAFVARLGSELGLKTAIYSSPHFESYCERFTIDNQMVSEDVLNPVLQRVLTVVEQLDGEIEANVRTCRPATFFDISTAAALLLFAEQHTELVALEVGLGGRLDSTNICNPLATIITSISLDHTKQLGNTTAEIAREKAAIIKSPVPAICGSVSDDVFAVIEEQAKTNSAPLLRFGQDFHVQHIPEQENSAELGTLMFNYFEPESSRSIESLQINGLGRHQCHNATLAIKAISEILPELPVEASLDFDRVVQRALAGTKLKGRLEVISRDPLVIIDMAHNEASIEAMLSCFVELKIPGPKQAIFSCSNDKDHAKMLTQMIPFFDRIFLTEFESNPRAQSRERLQETSERIAKARQDSIELVSNLSPAESLDQALSKPEDYGLTVVCGSIFLVGEMLPLLEQHS